MSGIRAYLGYSDDEPTAFMMDIDEEDFIADLADQYPSVIYFSVEMAPTIEGEVLVATPDMIELYQRGVLDGLATAYEESGSLASSGDQLASAAAQVCVEYDGIHRLRAALSKWFDVRAGIHGSKGNS